MIVLTPRTDSLWPDRVGRVGKRVPRFLRTLSCERGVTLVELLVAMALITTLILLGVSVYSLSTRSFVTGESQSVIQREVRTAANLIGRELRNSIELSIVSSAVPGDGSSYILIQNSRLARIDGEGVTHYFTSGILEEQVPFFSLQSEASGRSTLQFSVKGVQGGQEYTLSSAILLNNIRDVYPAQGQVVRYVSP